jgi:cell division protease FtsH
MDEGICHSTETTLPSSQPRLDPLGALDQRPEDIASKRKRQKRRIMRISRRILFWGGLLGLAYWIWSDPVRLNTFLQALAFGARLLFAMMFMIVQFGTLFWFMSRTRQIVIKPGDPKSITFEDYKGQDRLVGMVKQWLSLLNDRTDFLKMGGRYINGLLLYGPPGTGKTLLAKCMAGEANVAFISVEGSSFAAMFIGIAPLKMMSFVRKARKLAREYGACIAFIIDPILRPVHAPSRNMNVARLLSWRTNR